MYVVEIDEDKCNGCGECVAVCPSEMFGLRDGKAFVKGEPDDCAGCLSCQEACPTGAITVTEI